MNPIIYDNVVYGDEYFLPVTNKEIPNVEENRYFCSNYGKIFDKILNRLLKPSKRPDGYLVVSLRTNNKVKTYLLHRVVALLFIPRNQSRLIVNHQNGIKDQCYYYNLEWTTHAENTRHAVDELGFNRYNYKEEPRNIVTEEQVNQICKLLDEEKFTYQQIADKCNIESRNPTAIVTNIRRGNTHKNISKNYNFSKDYNKPYRLEQRGAPENIEYFK